MSHREINISELTMLSIPVSQGSARSIAVANIVLVAVNLFVFSCPPGSLKGVIAQRGQCQFNLKEIFQTHRNRGNLLDASHAEQIRGFVKELNLTCQEGTAIRGHPALYSGQIKDGLYMITEDRENHPARMRIMAGTQDEKRHGIDAGGKVLHLQ